MCCVYTATTRNIYVYNWREHSEPKSFSAPMCLVYIYIYTDVNVTVCCVIHHRLQCVYTIFPFSLSILFIFFSLQSQRCNGEFSRNIHRSHKMELTGKNVHCSRQQDEKKIIAMTWKLFPNSDEAHTLSHIHTHSVRRL